jgi:hypothetical protein
MYESPFPGCIEPVRLARVMLEYSLEESGLDETLREQ